MSASPPTTEGADAIAELAGSGLIDGAWYLDHYTDVGAARVDPVAHYLHHGAAEGRWPNRYFDPAWYLRSNPDVAEAGLGALTHYLRHGDAEGRRPHPFFDPGWYRAAYDLPADTLALWHFLLMRDTGRFAPCAELYAVPLLAPWRDLAGAGDPIGRYLDDMERDRREALPDLAVVSGSGLIDENYYLINASDVLDAALDPAIHYCRFGWREQRRPNIYFDVHWYAATNPDLARLRVNPLVHYILEGEPRDRRPVPYFDPGWYRATYGVPEGQNALAHYLAHRRSQTVSPNPLFDVAWYVAQHAGDLRPNRDPFAHYLQAGTLRDIDPSPRFDARAYRRRHLGRPSRAFPGLVRPDQDNPLVHHLRASYR